MTLISDLALNYILGYLASINTDKKQSQQFTEVLKFIWRIYTVLSSDVMSDVYVNTGTLGSKAETCNEKILYFFMYPRSIYIFSIFSIER